MVVCVLGHYKEYGRDSMPVLTAAILRVPRNNTSPFFKEKQVAPHEAAGLDVRCPLLEPETKVLMLGVQGRIIAIATRLSPCIDEQSSQT